MRYKFPNNNAPAFPSDLVADSAGNVFSPDSCSHAYTYDANGNIATDTAIDNEAVTRTKTYTFDANSRLTAQSKWIVAP